MDGTLCLESMRRNKREGANDEVASAKTEAASGLFHSHFDRVKRGGLSKWNCGGSGSSDHGPLSSTCENRRDPTVPGRRLAESVDSLDTRETIAPNRRCDMRG